MNPRILHHKVIMVPCFSIIYLRVKYPLRFFVCYVHPISQVWIKNCSKSMSVTAGLKLTYSQRAKSEQIARCQHAISFGWTHNVLSTNSDTIKADTYIFVCSASYNCHLVAYIFPTQKIYQWHIPVTSSCNNHSVVTGDML